jgi:hypothetical protein
MPQFSFASGGLVTGSLAGGNTSISLAVLDDRQAKREWDARKGRKALAKMWHKSGNSFV